MELALSTRDESGHAVIEVSGEIDVYTAPALREQLIEVINNGAIHIIVDMNKVDFLDSTGLGVLVGGLKRVRSHEGSLRLVCVQKQILKILNITGLDKVFSVFDSVNEAINGKAVNEFMS